MSRERKEIDMITVLLGPMFIVVVPAVLSGIGIYREKLGTTSQPIFEAGSLWGIMFGGFGMLLLFIWLAGIIKSVQHTTVSKIRFLSFLCAVPLWILLTGVVLYYFWSAYILPVNAIPEAYIEIANFVREQLQSSQFVFFLVILSCCVASFLKSTQLYRAFSDDKLFDLPTLGSCCFGLHLLSSFLSVYSPSESISNIMAWQIVVIAFPLFFHGFLLYRLYRLENQHMS